MKNQIDQKFFDLIDYINHTSKNELINKLKFILTEYKNKYEYIYNELIEYYKKYSFWGIIDELNNNYENLNNRINCLKEHIDDFVCLYNRLEDYTSKYVLWAILLNWLVLNINEIGNLKSFYNQYFDLDLISTNENDVFVDCGAYIGDTLVNYINTYGRNYKRYYAYEMNEDVLEALNNNISSNGIENIIVKNYGVGNINSTSYKEDNESASKITDKGTKIVKIVKLDDDLKDVPTYIKMDIEGYEEKALLGSSKLIKAYKPKLAISLYHGYDDLWKLPKLIDNLNANYKFYLRHYGGNLVPTEFILYCI